MPDTNDEGLKELFGASRECIPVERLASISSPGAEDDAARRHVEGCAHCQNELAMLRAFESSAATPAEADSVEWITAKLRQSPVGAAEVERRLPFRETRSKSLWEVLTGWFPRGLPAWVPAGAAACVLLATVSGVYVVTRQRGVELHDTRGDDVWRSATVQVIGPVGNLNTPPAEFTWHEVAGSVSYHVRVLEVDRTEVWSGDTKDTRIAVPRELAPHLKPGRSFLWQVVAKNSTAVIAESTLQQFHIILTEP